MFWMNLMSWIFLSKIITLKIILAIVNFNSDNNLGEVVVTLQLHVAFKSSLTSQEYFTTF